MLNKKDLETELNSSFIEKYPEEAGQFEVMLVSAERVDPESDFIKRTVLDFQLAFNSDKYDSISNLYMACEQLAEALGELDLISDLTKIWDGSKLGMSVPDMEYLIIKSIRGQTKLSGYEIEGEVYTHSALNRLLRNAKREIYRIFGKMQMLYNIKPADFDWSKQITKSDASITFDDLKI